MQMIVESNLALAGAGFSVLIPHATALHGAGRGFSKLTTLMKTKTKLRDWLMKDDNMTNKPVALWSDEQRRLGGAWSKHELEAQHDGLTCAYDWIPGWTTLSAEEIQKQLLEFYMSRIAKS